MTSHYESYYFTNLANPNMLIFSPTVIYSRLRHAVVVVDVVVVVVGWWHLVVRPIISSVEAPLLDENFPY